MASSNTTIEWTDRTWNPLRGCTRVSEGCTNCYAEKIAYRFSGEGQAFEGLARKVGNEARWTGKIMLVEKELETPFHWKKPARVFVNSVSDLFHKDVPFDYIDEVFYTMALTPQHTYQILTKRPERMLEYFKSVKRRFDMQLGRVWLSNGQYIARPYGTELKQQDWPLKNVWVGTSVENQETADERIQKLLRVPATVRFLSCEPLLGPIDLTNIKFQGDTEYFMDCLSSRYGSRAHKLFNSFGMAGIGKIDWVIAGGESGRAARPMHPDWANSLRDQCKAARVAFFFKQWGNWQVTYDRNDDPDARNLPMHEGNNTRWLNLAGGHGFHGEHVVFVRNVGKHTAGRELDGRTWDEMPALAESSR